MQAQVLQEIQFLTSQLRSQSFRMSRFLDYVCGFLGSESRCTNTLFHISHGASLLLGLDPNVKRIDLDKPNHIEAIDAWHFDLAFFKLSSCPHTLLELIQIANADSPNLLLDNLGTPQDAHTTCLNLLTEIIELLAYVPEKLSDGSFEDEFLLKEFRSIKRRHDQCHGLFHNEYRRAQKFYVANAALLDDYIKTSQDSSFFDIVKEGSNEHYLVLAMVDLGCFGEETKKSIPEIVEGMDANGDPNSYKRYFTSLQKKNVIEKGANNRGFYLLPRFLPELGVKKIDTGAPPTKCD